MLKMVKTGLVPVQRLLSAAAVLCIMMAGLVGSVNAQEHSYAPSDIENGRGLYQANCLGCHGDTGDEVDGVRFSSGRFSRASSDEDLIRLIREGIPNTLMVEKSNLSYGDTRALVAFLRSIPGGGMQTALDEREVNIGNALAGASVFNGNAQCNVCHGVSGGGNLLSPDLANIGATRSPAFLEQAILEPHATVRQGDRFYEVTENNGTTVSGLLLNQDTHSVQMMNGDEQLVTFVKDDLSAHRFITSPMPIYLDVLSTGDVADLVAYMISLKAQ